MKNLLDDPIIYVLPLVLVSIAMMVIYALTT